MAIEMASRGYDLLLTSRSEQLLKETAKNGI